MPGPSAIEWTEATWNPVTGCDKVSPGCAHCYAETFAERWRGIPGHPYEQGFDLKPYVAAKRILGPVPPSSVARCRECGCLDFAACESEELGPCWWVEEDLCSGCHPDLVGGEWEHPPREVTDQMVAEASA